MKYFQKQTFFIVAVLKGIPFASKERNVYLSFDQGPKKAPGKFTRKNTAEFDDQNMFYHNQGSCHTLIVVQFSYFFLHIKF